MKVLMIGGTALVGPEVIRELTGDGFAVVSTLTRSGRSYYFETAFTGDRDNENALFNALNEVNPDVIIDMIPFTVKNAEILASMCRRLDAMPRLIAVSSIDVYRAYGRLSKTEDAPHQPSPIREDMALRTAYGPEGAAYDKIGVERIYREAFVDLTILRMPAIYGWPDTTRVQFYLDQMLKGATKIKIPKDRASFKFSRCLHKNAAFAISLAVRSDLVGQRIYNVAEHPTFTEYEWAQRIAQHCGWPGDFEVSEPNEEASKPLQHFEVDTQAIRNELGFEEKFDPAAGLADTIAFYAYSQFGKQYEKYY